MSRPTILFRVFYLIIWTSIAVAANGWDDFGRDDALLIQAAIVGDTDERMPIDQNMEQTGLTLEEVQTLRRSTGYIICPGTDSRPVCLLEDNGEYAVDPSRVESGGTYGSASLVGSNMQVLTNLHVFFDKCGQLVAPLNACNFVPQSANNYEEWQRYGLRFDGSERVGKGLRLSVAPLPSLERYLSVAGDVDDYAVVPLSSPVLSARPLPVVIGLGNDALVLGDRIVAISSYQSGLENRFGPFVPIGTSCRIRAVEFRELGDAALFATDCDQTPGASGGANLIRRKGNLSIRAISVAAHVADGSDFWSNESYSIAIGVKIIDALVSVRENLPAVKGLYFGSISGRTGEIAPEGMAVDQ